MYEWLVRTHDGSGYVVAQLRAANADAVIRCADYKDLSANRSMSWLEALGRMCMMPVALQPLLQSGKQAEPVWTQRKNAAHEAYIAQTAATLFVLSPQTHLPGGIGLTGGCYCAVKSRVLHCLDLHNAELDAAVAAAAAEATTPADGAVSSICTEPAWRPEACFWGDVSTGQWRQLWVRLPNARVLPQACAQTAAWAEMLQWRDVSQEAMAAREWAWPAGVTVNKACTLTAASSAAFKRFVRFVAGLRKSSAGSATHEEGVDPAPQPEHAVQDARQPAVTNVVSPALHLTSRVVAGSVGQTQVSIRLWAATGVVPPAHSRARVGAGTAACAAQAGDVSTDPACVARDSNTPANTVVATAPEMRAEHAQVPSPCGTPDACVTRKRGPLDRYISFSSDADCSPRKAVVVHTSTTAPAVADCARSEDGAAAATAPVAPPRRLRRRVASVEE